MRLPRTAGLRLPGLGFRLVSSALGFRLPALGFLVVLQSCLTLVLVSFLSGFYEIGTLPPLIPI